MNPVDIILALVNLDSKTLLGILVWGNLALGSITYLYEFTNKDKFDSHFTLRNLTFIRFLSALGYLFLFLRGVVPDLLSANAGNSILFLCYYLESRILLKSINLYGKKIHIIGTSILVLSIAAFNLLEFMYHDASIRIGIASIALFFLLLPPAVLLTLKQTSKFRQSTGIFYIPLVAALIPRGIEAFLGKITNLVANTYYQTFLFCSLVLLMIVNTIIYLLFMKEKTDSVIEKMANYDNLTNVMNRHSFFARGKALFEKQKENGQVLAVLFLDIDFFKKINDIFGHKFGDDVLVKFADTIKNNIRPADICCRYGGEEFIVLANVNEESCKRIANRILSETEKIAFDSVPDFHMTTSIGCIAGSPEPSESLEDFIGRADTALYKAKNEGRNRIVFYNI